MGPGVWRIARWVVGVGCAATAALGCAGSLDAPDPRWSSPHFRYFADADDPAPCAAVTDLLERHFAFMQSYLGFDWPAGKMVDYDKFRDSNAFQTSSNCDPRTAACESEGTVKSTVTFDGHELMHAYLSPNGRPPALFEEGVAVALDWRRTSCSALEGPRNVELSWADAIRIGDPYVDGRIYFSGARLVAHLLRGYDPHLFMRLYRALPTRSVTPEMVSDQMMNIYGKSGDELWAETVADTVPFTGCVPAWPCARDELPLDGSAVQLAASCPGIDFDQRAVQLTDTTNLLLSATADSQLSLFACDAAAPPPPSFLFPITDGPDRGGLINLGPGRYFFQFYNFITDLSLTIPAAPPAGTDCAALQPLTLSSSQFPIHVASPLSSEDWYVALQLGPPDRTLTVDNSATTDLLVCPSCDFTSAACTAIPKTMQSLDVALQQVVYARMRGPAMEIHTPY